MASQQLRLVCDNSTLANFKAWAKPISDWFRTCGWTNSSDTGQVNWTSIASVPGALAYVYDIFQPGDGLQNFYVKVEYGNTAQSSANAPSLRISIGTGTNGAGTLTLLVTTAHATAQGNYTPPSTTTQFECNFSGDSGRIGVMMWRDGGATAPQLFVIERSLDSTGTYYGTSTTGYVTFICGGNAQNNNNGAWPSYAQQSLVFGVGVTVTTVRANNGSSVPQLGLRSPFNASMSVGADQTQSFAFNGKIPFDLVSPVVGFWDFPMTMLGGGPYADIVEGVPFGISLYGSTRTYMPTKAGTLGAFLALAVIGCIAMRYD
jgi:hypothetical protein